MSDYSLYYDASLVAPALLRDNNFQIGEYNHKNFLVGAAQTDFPDGFPRNLDPFWTKYPKELWYAGINLINPNVVWTRIEFQSHYLMYVPASNDPEIKAYAALLKENVFNELLIEINNGERIDYTRLLTQQQKIDRVCARKEMTVALAAAAQAEREKLKEINKQQANSRAARLAARNNKR